MKFEFSAGIIIYSHKNGRRRFLFLKRGEGWLDIPKGHIEKGEDAVSAAIRETREEARLEVTPDRDFRYKIEYWFVRDGERIKKGVTLFVAEVRSSSEVTISGEHVGYEWLDFDSARKIMKFKTQLEALEAAESYLDRKEQLAALNEEYGRLPAKSRGWRLSRRFVPGEGPANAKIMIVGQAPGAYEDEQGRPFVGISGKLLDRLIGLAGLRRGNVYITSVVQFFPPNNRVPTPGETGLCLPFLERQIGIIRPKLIVTLGNFPGSCVAGIKSVTKVHGAIVKSGKFGCDVFVTLHPAAAVRMKKHLPTIEGDFKRLKALAAGL